MDQGGASKATRRGQGQWPAIVLLLALALVGHDLLMTMPRAHAAPASSLPAHHQVATLAHELGSLVGTHSWITHPHSVSECPAVRIARVPTGIAVEAQASTGFGCDLTLALRVSPVSISHPTIPPLSAETRRALLQVFLV